MANKDSDGFFPAVYEVVRQIPRGRVMSYGQIARLLGFPRAARQVGWAMRCCSDDICNADSPSFLLKKTETDF